MNHVYVHGPNRKFFRVHVARKTATHIYTTFGTFRTIDKKWIASSNFYITDDKKSTKG